MKTTSQPLTKEIYARALNRAKSSAGPRYTPGLPGKSDFPNVPIITLLDDISGLERSEHFWSNLEQIVNDIGEARLSTASNLEVCKMVPGLNGLIKYSEKSIDKLFTVLNEDVFSQSHTFEIIPLKRLRSRLRGLKRTLCNVVNIIEKYEREPKVQSELNQMIESEIRSLKSRVYTLQHCLTETGDFINGKAFTIANDPIALLVGDVGTGKTHFFCDLAYQRLKRKLPTIIALAQDLNPSKADILQSVISHLGIRTSKRKFLQYLANHARRSGVRALIVVDGINEGHAEHWKRGTSTLVSDLVDYPEIGLVLTCRYPFEQIYMRTRSRKRFTRLLHPGFQENEVRAHTAFFQYYGIPPPQVPLLPAEFANPLFLKIVCETLRDALVLKKHRQIQEIASGLKGFTKLFEDYVRHAEEQASRTIENDYRPGLLRKRRWLWDKGDSYPGVIKEAAQLMVDRGKSNIRIMDLDQILARYVVDERYIAPIRRLLITEGIFLQAVDWKDNRPEEVFTFPYQKVSDHLIVRTALRKISGADEKQVRQLIRNWKDQPNLIEALMIEIPVRTAGREYFDFIETKKIRVDLLQSFMAGLIWRAPDTFSARTEQVMITCLKWSLTQADALETVLSMSTRPGHPCGARTLQDFLTNLNMAVRDEIWTEYLRRSYKGSVPIRLLDWIPATDLQRLNQAECGNYIRLLKWYLTSTKHRLRDLATKAIYLLGCNYPEVLFAETLDSLKLNDPYVSERMLASSYGVSMTLYGNFPKTENQFRKCVPSHARKLYFAMFAKSARFATTHALSRDYALRTIQLAIVYQPNLFGKQAKRRISPPFLDGGIRRWYRSKDRNEREYRDGDAPIGFDFDNYILGPLAFGRSVDDPEPLDLKKIHEQVLWRIYQLGYSLKRFSSIDQEIVRLNYGARTPAEDAYRVDRYGKKYSWIAYHELYGHLVDKAWIDPYPRRTRPDIDPSFSDGARPIKAVHQNLLGDRSRDLVEWIRRARMPSMKDSFVLSELDGSTGPWVLLDAAIAQSSRASLRRCSVFPHAYLVTIENWDMLLKYWHKLDDKRTCFPEVPSRFDSFSGEMPWSDTIGYNERDSITFTTGTRKYEEPVTDLEFRRNGMLLSGDEKEQFRESLSQVLQGSDEEQMIAAYVQLLEETNIQVVETTRLELRHEPIQASIDVEVPVREIAFSGQDSCTNPQKTAAVPSKEICERFGLRLGLPFWDMHDANGKVASISTSWGEEWPNKHSMTYIREDLLKTYLRDRNLCLMWIVRIERMVHTTEVDVVRSEYPPGTTLAKRSTQLYSYSSKGVERVR